MDISSLQDNTKNLNTHELLSFLNEHYKHVVFSSSLSIEDQVLTDIIYKANLNIEVFTLDTGRLPKETYDLLEQNHSTYKKRMTIFFPDFNHIEALTSEKGYYSFYNDIESRKECCAIRKVKPLKRALKNKDVWITGLRRSQSPTRMNMRKIEYGSGFGLIKVNPLIDWSEEAVWEYIKTHRVPYSQLYNKGYKSIGCAPCTRAIPKDADIRSGRWWWEDPNKKECGLHIPITQK